MRVYLSTGYSLRGSGVDIRYPWEIESSAEVDASDWSTSPTFAGTILEKDVKLVLDAAIKAADSVGGKGKPIRGVVGEESELYFPKDVRPDLIRDALVSELGKFSVDPDRSLVGAGVLLGKIDASGGVVKETRVRVWILPDNLGFNKRRQVVERKPVGAKEAAAFDRKEQLRKEQEASLAARVIEAEERAKTREEAGRVREAEGRIAEAEQRAEAAEEEARRLRAELELERRRPKKAKKPKKALRVARKDAAGRYRDVTTGRFVQRPDVWVDATGNYRDVATGRFTRKP